MTRFTQIAVIFLFLNTIFSATAQERDRFNIGIHYNPPIANQIDDLSIGADFRVRAISLGIVNLGAGLSATYRVDNEKQLSDYVIWNPQAYAEFQPFSFALKPYVGVGYAFYSQTVEIQPRYVDQYDSAFATGNQKLKYSGITVNLGARFDFAKILFADLGLGYSRLTAKSPRLNTFGTNGNGTIHIGLGVRF